MRIVALGFNELVFLYLFIYIIFIIKSLIFICSRYILYINRRLGI